MTTSSSAAGGAKGTNQALEVSDVNRDLLNSE